MNKILLLNFLTKREKMLSVNIYFSDKKCQESNYKIGLCEKIEKKMWKKSESLTRKM